MKKLPITLLAAALLAFTPAMQAKDKPEKSKGKPETVETVEAAEKTAGDKKDAAVKGLSREEHAKRKAALEKADADPAVADLRAKDEAAAKKLAALKRSKDAKPEDILAADKEADAAHEAYVKGRRAAVAKVDPEAAKLDERAFAVTEKMRKAKESKAKDADDAVEGAKGKGKGLERAPGQLKKTQGGDATDYAPGQTKKKKKDKGDKDE